MALGERALIERFFRDCGAHRADVRVGIGDDAALLDVPAGMELVARWTRSSPVFISCPMRHRKP
jgi:thiamine monophosphate kinase